MKDLKPLRIFIASALALVPFTLLGCCGGGGSNVKTESQNINTTLGTELRDLKAAYDEGIITEKQYNEAKERLMKERTKGD